MQRPGVLRVMWESLENGGGMETECFPPRFRLPGVTMMGLIPILSLAKISKLVS